LADHNDLGRAGELAAAEYLIMKGYEIRERNWYCGHVDLDIIAERLGHLVFVEVKTRSSDVFEAPEEAVDLEKRRNLLKAGNAYILQKRLDEPYRFDIITLVGQPGHFRLRHIKDAFEGADWHDDQVYDGGLTRQYPIGETEGDHVREELEDGDDGEDL
jgi:putative endonuclease